eukprot:11305582-Ditylum_brightwellii.AAC.1
MSSPSKRDVVHLDVRGTLMTVRRSTLRICKGSVLERQFDDSIWTNQHSDKAHAKKWSYEEVVEWAKKHDEIPDEVASIFQKNKVNGLELLALGREELNELGIQRPGTLALVAKAIHSLRNKDQNRVFVDQRAYCFGKIIDQLRLMALCQENYKPLALTDIHKMEREAFLRTVDFYFPGDIARQILISFHSNFLATEQIVKLYEWLSEE